MKIFITGVNRGLGQGLVEVFLEKGFEVYGGYYPHIPFTPLSHPSFHPIPLDISSLDSVKAAFEMMSDVSLDIILNNAGIIPKTETHGGDSSIFAPLDFEQILNAINVNAVGMLRVCNVFMPLLLKSERKLIVNISSEAGSIANSFRKGWFGYCMSKAALNMGATVVHNGFKDVGGQVLQIHPGWVQSYMSGKLNTNGTYTPYQSASHIFEVIEDSINFDKNKVEFRDLLNNKMEW